MAMFYCPECQNRISNRAESCIFCGLPSKHFGEEHTASAKPAEIKVKEESKAPGKPVMLTIKEAAVAVDGLSAHRIRQMCIRGELPYIKAGSKFLINKKKLLEAIGEKTQ